MIYIYSACIAYAWKDMKHRDILEAYETQRHPGSICDTPKILSIWLSWCFRGINKRWTGPENWMENNLKQNGKWKGKCNGHTDRLPGGKQNGKWNEFCIKMEWKIGASTKAVSFSILFSVPFSIPFSILYCGPVLVLVIPCCATFPTVLSWTCR